MIKNGYTRFCITAAFLMVLIACENDYDQIQDLQRKKLTVDEVIKVESYLSQAGVVKAKLTAPYMLRFYDSVPRVEFPRTLHVDFYNDSMAIESYLDAKKGFYYEQQNRVILNDSVVVSPTQMLKYGRKQKPFLEKVLKAMSNSAILKLTL
jgi:hypothetical protein